MRELGAIVIGGGISGIAAVVRLRRHAGIDDVLLIEKSEALGGTWNDNRYPTPAAPGAAARISGSRAVS